MSSNPFDLDSVLGEQDRGAGDVFDLDAVLAKQGPPPPQKPLSTWEKIQQASGGIWGGFGQELPNVGQRFLNLGSDIAQGGTDIVKEKLGIGQDPESIRRDLRNAEAKWRARQQFEEESTPYRNEPSSVQMGRFMAKAAPQLGLAAATGGASLPAQAASAGSLGLLQALSEGASPASAGVQAALAGGGTYAGPIVNKVASWVKAPFAKYADDAALKAAERLGVELPASAATTSPVARNVETLSGKLLGGQAITERAGKAAADLAERAGDLSAGASATNAGLALGKDYGAEVAAARAAKNLDYGALGDLTKIPAPPGQTVAEIQAMRARGTLAPDVLERLAKLEEALSPVKPKTPGLEKFADDPNMLALIEKQLGQEGADVATPRSVADLMSQQAGIEYGGPSAISDAALGNKLRDLLNKDIDAALKGTGEAAKLAKAKASYGQYADLSQSGFGKSIAKLTDAEQFDKVVGAVVHPKASVQDIQKVMSVAQAGTQDEIRQTVLADIIGATGGNEVKLTPEKIASGIKRWSPARLKAILTDEQMARLKDMVTVSRAMGRASKISEGSQTTPWLKTSQYLTAPWAIIGAILSGNPATGAGIAAGLGLEAAISRTLGSKAGQRWLTTGLAPATLPGRLTKGLGIGSARIAAEVEREKRKRRMRTLPTGGSS